MCPENEITPAPANNQKSTLLLVAFIFMIINTISIGVFLIPLAWCIPMTISCYKCYNENQKPSVAFGVCTLLFVSLISGILLLIESSSDN